MRFCFFFLGGGGGEKIFLLNPIRCGIACLTVFLKASAVYNLCVMAL